MSPTLRRVTPIILAIAFAALTAVPVLAHADLVTSDPADKAVLAEPPTTVTLTFSEGLDASKSSFNVIGSDGTVLGTGKAGQDGATDMTLGGLALVPGAYGIKWTSVAEDGHVERGTLSFNVAEPTPPPATPEPTASASETPTAAPAATPAAPTPAASPAASAVAVTTGDQTSAGSGSDVVLPLAVALVLVAVVGAYVLRRSRAA
jgi:copper resistance protein C